ncbi:MAG: UvrD-helicase domain-containing protein [Verrucomicrobia bacterium]|jgi:DNA helicase-2/ATP-dependent DNA helicase PcrA|nr:UvrD-helicase domain-containing protein [Verrucomicrobiota bacterium]
MSREYVLHPFPRAADLHIDYAREVNEQQLAAVTAPPGPALVIAGAGSGKTRTLTYRVAYLLEQGIPADRILLLTFTNKAAREMMRRVEDLLGGERSDLWGGTFHSIGNRILRLYADRLGYERGFSILDQEDARHLVATCIAEAGIDTRATRFPKAEVLGAILSLAVNKRMSLPEVVAQQYPYFLKLLPQMERVQGAYAGRKRQTGAMDFDDLLVLWLRLLEEHADVRESLQRRFQFILVDEYQDTNRLQGDLVDLLAARHQNLMAVGDDAQSIYGWRGASFQNILEFPRRYPHAVVYKIETNYRSTPEILTLANAAIRSNARQFAKDLAPARPAGRKPVVVPCLDARQQALFVAQRLVELHGEGRSLNRMAVLYRSHFHALELQLELTRHNIPFSITSGVRFFEQAHIKDVTAHLKLVANARDELAFKRIVLLLPGLGPKAAEKLWGAFRDRATGAASTQGGTRPLATAFGDLLKLVPKKAQVAWAQLTSTMAQLEAAATEEARAGVLMNLVVEAGYRDYLQANYENARSRLEDIEQLGAFSEQFSSLQEFLAQLALLTNLEAEEADPGQGDTERARLSTIHQAKGLEFDVVFVIMLCDGLFPSARSLEAGDGEEEERRLLYVAVTRARDELYLCYPAMRALAGGGAAQAQLPSRFLKEIPEDLRETWDLVNGARQGQDGAAGQPEGQPEW